MKRFSLLILVFAILFAVFFIVPPLLSQQFSPYPLMKIGDVFDILTPSGVDSALLASVSSR